MSAALIERLARRVTDGSPAHVRATLAAVFAHLDHRAPLDWNDLDWPVGLVRDELSAAFARYHVEAQCQRHRARIEIVLSDIIDATEHSDELRRRLASGLLASMLANGRGDPKDGEVRSVVEALWAPATARGLRALLHERWSGDGSIAMRADDHRALSAAALDELARRDPERSMAGLSSLLSVRDRTAIAAIFRCEPTPIAEPAAGDAARQPTVAARGRASGQRSLAAALAARSSERRARTYAQWLVTTARASRHRPTVASVRRPIVEAPRLGPVVFIADPTVFGATLLEPLLLAVAGAAAVAGRSVVFALDPPSGALSASASTRDARDALQGARPAGPVDPIILDLLRRASAAPAPVERIDVALFTAHRDHLRGPTREGAPPTLLESFERATGAKPALQLHVFWLGELDALRERPCAHSLVHCTNADVCVLFGVDERASG
jgi:hypothetical protein